MTHSTALWGIAAITLTAIAAMLAGIWIGYGRGWDHATEEAEWQRQDAQWKKLADPAAPPAPPAPPETPHAGPGKHRHPPGPRHAALPVAGYLPAPDDTGPWNATLTLPAPVQQAPWDAPPPEPEPQTEVLEPTAVLSGPPETDTAWTRRMCAELQAYMDELKEQTEPYLKELTR